MISTPSTLAREAGTSVRATRPRRRRPSISHILIALAVVLSFGLNYLALQSRDATTTVALAADGLTEGEVFHTGAVELVQVPADMAGLDRLLSNGDLEAVEGWIVARSVPPDSLVDTASLVPPASHTGRRLMSVPIAIEHAAGGSIAIGDRIDVIAVTEGVARFVASNLEVTNVAQGDKGALSSRSGYFVVVAVGSSEALDLARAMEEGSIEIVRSTGAAPAGEER